MVLSTATVGNLRDVDFLPLTVDVEERMYAAGKIPGSFFKREGRSGEKGTLTARMIDRPIRPLFPKGWRYETQLVSIPLSIDHVHPYDILAMNGASAALMISDIPFPTPVGAVRIGKVDGNFVVNPDEEDLLENTDLDLVVAGTEEAILMVEAGANEIPEAEILDALDIAHDAIKKLCAAAARAAREGRQGEDRGRGPADRRGAARADQASRTARALDEATQVVDKLERQDATQGRRGRRSSSSTPGTRAEDVRRASAPGGPARVRQAREGDHPPAHRRRQEAPRRPRREGDPRRSRSRPASLPRTHGSALFTRGQTQALSVVALGTLQARRCGSTRSGSRPPSATGTTTTSRPSRSGRRASCAGPSAATSVTARWPSARWCR